MSVQHSVFNEETSEFIGSPQAVRKVLSQSRRLSAADFSASRVEVLSAIHFVRPAFVHHVPVDPVRHPADLCQSVRAFGVTERYLESLREAFGFSFWGEAAALVLGYAAAFPEDFEVQALKDRAPGGLLKSKGAIKRGKTLSAPAVRGMQVPLTAETMAYVGRVAAWQRLSRKDAATLILHRHAPRVLALVVGGAQ